ncbi:MAG: 30S ribosomal protein S8 [Verrucomicrobia bacterium]|nr:30S ribosomal protein S8 [Verrucomicrobiota bacterium]
MVTDPLADFLTELRNASTAGLKKIKTKHSRMRGDVLAILKKEGFIEDFELKKDGKHTDFHISLKAGNHRNGKAITCIRRLSKPGLRRYVGVREIPRYLGGLGVPILSTPRGVMSGEEAKKQNVGGELLLVVW